MQEWRNVGIGETSFLPSSIPTFLRKISSGNRVTAKTGDSTMRRPSRRSREREAELAVREPLLDLEPRALEQARERRARPLAADLRADRLPLAEAHVELDRAEPNRVSFARSEVHFHA